MQAPRKKRASPEYVAPQWIYSGTVAEVYNSVQAGVRVGDILIDDSFGRVEFVRMSLEAGFALVQMVTPEGADEKEEFQVHTRHLRVDHTVSRAHDVCMEGGGAGSCSSDPVEPQPAKKRVSRGRKRRELTEDEIAAGVTVEQSSRKDVKRVRMRLAREAKAKEKGKPLKPAKPPKNLEWGSEVKGQVVDYWNAHFKHLTGPPRYEECAQQLRIAFPTTCKRLTRGHVQGFVQRDRQLRGIKPNELGLIETAAGRRPELPPDKYEALVKHVQGVCSANAFRCTATSLRPIAQAFIIHSMGPEIFNNAKYGKRAFSLSLDYLQKLARNAKLKFRKPYGDSRKPPPDADAQIEDMVQRTAYLMTEFSIPPSRVLNSDHTGLHFTQQRGASWTAVEEDKEVSHKSRRGKQKETKAQGMNDKRQATGVVTTTMSGEMVPGQLIVQGQRTSSQALPIIQGFKYVQSSGPQPGNKVGFQLKPEARPSNAGPSLDVSKHIGHLVQTANHWADIPTSYAILDQVIVPYLKAHARANGLPDDAPAIYIVDCWYGWKDQDKAKTLQNFREYLRERYPWLKLLFVPAACTDLVQPADRGQIAWIKAFMRKVYTTHFATEVLAQLAAGKNSNEIQLDFGAVAMKKMLATSFAQALAEMPKEKILNGWHILRRAVTDRVSLHAKASERLDVLFPNGRPSVPDDSEEDPVAEVEGDDFGEVEVSATISGDNDYSVAHSVALSDSRYLQRTR